MGTASHDVDCTNQDENEQPDHVDPNLRGPLVPHFRFNPMWCYFVARPCLRCVAAKLVILREPTGVRFTAPAE